MSISFIHTADVHIGMKFTKGKITGEQGKNRRDEIIDTFLKILDRCKERNVDYLFIAGDLFEDELCSIAELKIINDRFKLLYKTKVIMITGNHDYLNEKSLYKLIDWNENVYILDYNEIDKLSFEEDNIDIWGVSWQEKEKGKQDFSKIDLDINKFNVLLLHGDIFDKNSKYLPIDRKDIDKFGFDYIGLGHIHKHQYITDSICYPGSPEPLDFGELGEHGVIEGLIDDKGLTTKFIPISKRKYNIINIEINEKMSYNSILARILDIESEEVRKKNFFRIIIKGYIDRDIKDKIIDIESKLDNEFYFIQIIDKTEPDYDINQLLLENENNIIGEFIKEMIENDLNDEVMNRGLYIGLEELLREKVKLK
ncbi:exonuclease SbcCD subunit D [Clostridium sp. D2Q-11]|uniref:Exonuclease SbcCD subunit D n=1 Tax=Anaeromonas frigoriresistens TaxID=2683708 RepID=A0A942UYD5_9FIRM|nr:exonuclease SbcCD subunit D [Anaeromonas frigoriresistens]MBS4539261.1 exonuclease SbcCD subunit D [Anaeromonas frigoriresistens]